MRKFKCILLENNYAEDIIVWIFERKFFKLNSAPMHGFDKCPIYLKLTCIGRNFHILVNQIKSCHSHCYWDIKSGLFFRTNEFIPPFRGTRFALFLIALPYTILNVVHDNQPACSS